MSRESFNLQICNNLLVFVFYSYLSSFLMSFLYLNKPITLPMEEIIDNLINRLLASRKTHKAKVSMTYDEIKLVIEKAKHIFLEQPVLLELKAPIKVCGDIHGQFYDLLDLFDHAGKPGDVSYLFLGDYVDRGKNSIETMVLLLCFKIKYKDRFFLLRGNHESASINKIYGFYDECKRRYDSNLWKKFGECFNCLPISALIDKKILCMHGGISPDLVDIDQIRSIKRPTEIPDNGLLCDLLWSDPDQIIGWGDNDRGVSVTFGPDIVQNFLDTHDIDLICRAHQVVEDGYEFFGNQGVVTVFSAPNYCGEFDNAGAVMCVDTNLCCSFLVLKPSRKHMNARIGDAVGTPPRKK